MQRIKVTMEETLRSAAFFVGELMYILCLDNLLDNFIV